jgi:hypothetical protein
VSRGAELRRLSARLLALGVLAGSAMLAGRVAADAKPKGRVQGAISLPSPEFLKHVSIGYDDVVADVLWFQTMQYYGEWRLRQHGLEFFRHMVDCVIALDPHFEEAYRFAGMVLAEDMQRPDQAIALLQEGMSRNPRSWWLPFEAGFVEYVVRMDDAAACVWFERAAQVPGAPDFPRRFAAFVAGRAGDLQVSLLLWQAIAETTQNESLRQRALDYVAQLQATIRGDAPVPEWAKRKRAITRTTRDAGT